MEPLSIGNKFLPLHGPGRLPRPLSPSSPAYPAILTRLQSGAKLINVGCFLGFDLQRLAFDGAPSENIYGVDIINHWDVGFDMFRDRGTFKGHFIQAGILSSEDKELEGLRGEMDVINVAAVLHQWDWVHQVAAAKKLVGFSKVGTWVVGEQIGTENAREIANLKWKCPQWRHSPESFERMWKEVGEETGTAWKTETRLRTFEERGWDPEDAKWMEPGVLVIDWVVTRVS